MSTVAQLQDFATGYAECCSTQIPSKAVEHFCCTEKDLFLIPVLLEVNDYNKNPFLSYDTLIQMNTKAFCWSFKQNKCTSIIDSIVSERGNVGIAKCIICVFLFMLHSVTLTGK